MVGGIAMFSRSISDGVPPSTLFRPGDAGEKIVTRSLRGAAGDGMLKSASKELRHFGVEDERQRRRVVLSARAR
jgi:hypothetical protein